MTKQQLTVTTEDKVASRYTYTSNWFTQFFVLLWRANVQIRRDFLPVAISIVQNIFLSVLLGLIFRDVSFDQKGIQDFQGVLVFAVINTSFT